MLILYFFMYSAWCQTFAARVTDADQTATWLVMKESVHVLLPDVILVLL